MKEFLLVVGSLIYLRYVGMWIISRFDRMP